MTEPYLESVDDSRWPLGRVPRQRARSGNGAITGRVRGPDGRTIPGASAYLVEALPGEPYALPRLLESEVRFEDALCWVAWTPADGAGDFRFEDVPPGRWRLWLGSLETWQVATEAFVVEDGAVTLLGERRLERPGPWRELRGNVTWEHEWDRDWTEGEVQYWLRDDPCELGRQVAIREPGELSIHVRDPRRPVDLWIDVDVGSRAWLPGVELGEPVDVRARHGRHRLIVVLQSEESRSGRAPGRWVGTVRLARGARSQVVGFVGVTWIENWEVQALPPAPFFVDLRSEGRRVVRGPFRPEDVGFCRRLAVQVPPERVERVRGRVVRDGEPCRASRVRLEVAEPAEPVGHEEGLLRIGWLVPRRQRRVLASTTPGSAGGFTLRSERIPERPSVAVERDGRVVELGPLELPADGSPLELDLARGCRGRTAAVHVEVAGFAGPGGIVEIVQEGEAPRAASLDGRGRLLAGDLSPSVGWVVARHGGPRVGKPIPRTRQHDDGDPFPAGWREPGELVCAPLRPRDGDAVTIELDPDSARRVALAGSVRLGGERWIAVPRYHDHEPMPDRVSGWFFGVVPCDAPLACACWTEVSPAGEYAVSVPGPGAYLVLWSLGVDPRARRYEVDHKLLLAKRIELGPEPRRLDLDLPVGAVDLRTDGRSKDEDLDPPWLVLEREDGLRGAISLDPIDPHWRRFLPRIPAGPARVIRRRPEGGAEVDLDLEIPHSRAVIVDLRQATAHEARSG